MYDGRILRVDIRNSVPNTYDLSIDVLRDGSSKPQKAWAYNSGKIGTEYGII